jgi:UDP-N-acetylmuramoyl-tripeptide--D-alanyl-D-alanine ligase
LVVVRGQGGATLLDDTYNASPASTLAALNLLADMDVNGGRRIAVLGDMLELGSYEEVGHRLVGTRAADVVDRLITIGERARWIAEDAIAAGLAAAHVVSVVTASAAIEQLRLLLGPGDIVLVKGSRAARLDQIVGALSLPASTETQGRTY